MILPQVIWSTLKLEGRLCGKPNGTERFECGKPDGTETPWASNTYINPSTLINDYDLVVCLINFILSLRAVDHSI